MTLPSSGIMTAAMINTELSRASNAPFDINGTTERALAEVQSGTIRFSDFYGKSAGAPVDPTTDPLFIWVRLLVHLDESYLNTYPNMATGWVIGDNPIPGSGTALNLNPPTKFAGNTYFSASATAFLQLKPIAPYDLNIAYWTWECYLYLVGPGNAIVSHRNTGAAGWTWEANRIRGLINGAWSDSQMTWAQPSLNAWHHMAWVKNGTDLLMFVDGALVSTKSGVTSIQHTTTHFPLMGLSSAGGENPLNGYIDEMRFTASNTEPGAARYLADFTVRATPFPNSA